MTRPAVQPGTWKHHLSFIILYHPALWSSTDIGEALLGMGAPCEEENPDTSARPETREPSSLSPSDGAQELGERLHCVYRSAPQLSGHFGILRRILFSEKEEEEEKLEPKQKKFFKPPEIQIKQETRFARQLQLDKNRRFRPLTWVSLAGPVCLPIDSHPDEDFMHCPISAKRLSSSFFVKKKKVNEAYKK